LYVYFCGAFSKLKLRNYFYKGYAGFAEDNPDVGFIQIHLPSLLQAWRMRGESPLPALASQNINESSSDPFFAKIGWKKPIWDSSYKMFKTQSVIQAIEAYRPLPN
jgi:hypothetical protein